MAEPDKTGAAKEVKPSHPPTPSGGAVSGSQPLPIAIVLLLVAALFTFLFNRWLGGQKASSDLLVGAIKEFKAALDEAHELIQRHQSGKPVDGARTLPKSREILAVKLRALGTMKIQLAASLPQSESEDLEEMYGWWKASYMGDIGLIAAKEVCPASLADDFRGRHEDLCKWLNSTMHRASKGKVVART